MVSWAELWLRGTQGTEPCLILSLRGKGFIVGGAEGSSAERWSILMLRWLFVVLAAGGGTLLSQRELLAVGAAGGKCK